MPSSIKEFLKVTVATIQGEKNMEMFALTLIEMRGRYNDSCEWMVGELIVCVS